MALFINSVMRSLSEIVTDSTTTTPEQPLQEAVQDKAKVVSLDRVVKIKANESESNLTTQDAA